MGRTARDNEPTREWAIAGLVGGGALGSYNAFEIVNRETGRAHQLHVGTGGLSIGFGAGGGEPDYTLFKTRNEVTFDSFYGSGVRITSVNAGIIWGYSWTALTMYEGPVYLSPLLAKVVMKGTQFMLPGASAAAHGVAVLAYGSGRPSGTVRRFIELPQEFPPDKRLARVRVSGHEEKLIVLGDTLFDFDKFHVRSDAQAVLQKVAIHISERRYKNVTVVGHTDALGKAAYNQELSEKRAKAVKQWLVEHRVVGAKGFATKGEGERQPVAPNTTAAGQDNPEGRQKNRRVEFIFSK